MKMTKTQLRKQKSEQWKKENDWGLSPVERTAKRIKRAETRIAEMVADGLDTSIIEELLEQVKQEARERGELV